VEEAGEEAGEWAGQRGQRGQWTWVWMWMRVQRGGVAGWHARRESERERDRESGTRRADMTTRVQLHCTAFCSISASSRFCREFARCMPLPLPLPLSSARLSPHLSCRPSYFAYLPPPYIVVLPTYPPTHRHCTKSNPPSSIVQASPSL
jgi:hypothetical protein